MRAEQSHGRQALCQRRIVRAIGLGFGMDRLRWCRGGVIEQIKQGMQRHWSGGHQSLQAGTTAFDFVPGRVEQMIGQPVHTARHGLRLHARRAIGQHPQSLRRPGQQAETVMPVVALQLFSQRVQMLFWRIGAVQAVAHQVAARRCIGLALRWRFAVVGQRRDATIAAQAEPGAARLQVAPAEDVGSIRPPGGGAGRAVKELVAIAGHQQRVIRMGIQCEQNQAHGQISASIV